MNPINFSKVRKHNRIEVSYNIVGHGINTFLFGKIISISSKGGLLEIQKGQLLVEEKVKIVAIDSHGEIIWRLEGVLIEKIQSEDKNSKFIIIFNENLNLEKITLTEKEF